MDWNENMLKKFTILYAEDEIELRELIFSLLKPIVKKIFLAKDGQEGLELYQKNYNEIDIIITDVNMPKLSGLEMCEKIRLLNKTIPIIITTAHNDNDFLQKSIELGVSRFVKKPIDVNALVQIIQTVLEPILLKKQLDLEHKQNLEQMVINAKFSATGKLAAGITHEINTPLTYVKANIELIGYDVEDLEESAIKESLKASLKKVTDGISRMETIMNSMKEVSMQKVIKHEDVNVYSTLITAATLAWNKIKHLTPLYINGEPFNLDTSRDTFKFFASVQVQRIEQVWIIIINNALDELIKIEKFEKRKLTIDITENEEHIVVKFKDNAGGIPEDILEHLFEPFKGSKDSSGMGVGLSIAKKIIDDHKDATIQAYNEDDGAVFEITFVKVDFNKNIVKCTN